MADSLESWAIGGNSINQSSTCTCITIPHLSPKAEVLTE